MRYLITGIGEDPCTHERYPFEAEHEGTFDDTYLWFMSAAFPWSCLRDNIVQIKIKQFEDSN